MSRLYRHFFLLVGLLTLCVLVPTTSLNWSSEAAPPHISALLLRISIAPMYLMWMLWSLAQVSIVGPLALPQPWASILSLLGLLSGLLPYVLADYLMRLWRRPHNVSQRPELGSVDREF